MPHFVTRAWLLYLLTLFLLPLAARAQEPLPPAVALPGGVTRLDDVGLYSVTYRFDDGRTGAMPLGWTGPFTEATGIACLPVGTQNGRAAFLLHPPWRGGTGQTDQTFRLALPPAARITLSFAAAMQTGADAPGKSDGAVFRVFLNDKPLLRASNKNHCGRLKPQQQKHQVRLRGLKITLKSESAKADFVNLLPRLKSPGIFLLEPLTIYFKSSGSNFRRVVPIMEG